MGRSRVQETRIHGEDGFTRKSEQNTLLEDLKRVKKDMADFYPIKIGISRCKILMQGAVAVWMRGLKGRKKKLQIRQT